MHQVLLLLDKVACHRHLIPATDNYPIILGMIHIWHPWELSIFQDPHLPCPAMSKILSPPWPWTSNFKQTLSPYPLQMITNQLKENIIQGWLFMLSGTPFMSAFVFSINSLVLSGFPLISFHLVEASLFPFFVALHSCVCCCPRNPFYL